MAPIATPADHPLAISATTDTKSFETTSAAPSATSRLGGQTSSMVFQKRLPATTSTYVLSAGSGGHLYVPSSSNQIYRIQAGSEQTAEVFAIVETKGTFSEPVPPHKHKEAHDIFSCLRSALQTWADGESRILRAGDLASVPPGVVH